MTGINLFTRRNVPTLWASVPEPNQEYDASTNKPDMVKMLLADGDLEPTLSVVSCTYNGSFVL